MAKLKSVYAVLCCLYNMKSRDLRNQVQLWLLILLIVILPIIAANCCHIGAFIVQHSQSSGDEATPLTCQASAAPSHPAAPPAHTRWCSPPSAILLPPAASSTVTGTGTWSPWGNGLQARQAGRSRVHVPSSCHSRDLGRAVVSPPEGSGKATVIVIFFHLQFWWRCSSYQCPTTA